MNSLVVVGVGSPFAGDALGLDIVEALHQRRITKPGWEIKWVMGDRPGVSLLGLLGESDAAVIIDAMSSGAAPGTVRVLQRSELAGYDRCCSSHSLGVVEALDLGDKLHALPPDLRLIGVESGSELTDELLTRVVRLLVPV